MEITLYSYWRSTAAYRVRIALALKALRYTTVAVHLARNGGEQHQADYRALNPQQLVPTLDINGVVLSQSMAIIEHLEALFPQPSLLSADLVLRARQRAMVQIIACDIHPLDNLRVLQYLKGPLQQQQTAITTWYAHWIEQGFAAFETLLKHASGRYCFGNSISMADVFLIPQVYNANRFGVPLAAYPLITGINARCLECSAFQQAAPEVQPDAEPDKTK